MSLIKFQNENSNVILHRDLPYFIFLFINIILSYRIFLVSRFTDTFLLIEMAYIGFIFLYISSRIISRAFSRNYLINSLEVYLVILFFLPIVPAVAANLEFGQPLLFGLASFRDFYLLFGGLILYNMLRKGEISINLVEKSFVAVAWFCLLMFYYYSLFTNPAEFKETGLAGANELKGGEVYYRFNMTMIYFGSIYYFIKCFFKKSILYLIPSILFLSYILFFRMDRTSILVILFALGAFVAIGLNFKSTVLIFLGFLLPFLFAILMGIYFFPEAVHKYNLMFSDIIATIKGDPNPIGDESVRLYELQIAVEQIEKNPVLGNGKVSNKWKEGGYNYFYHYFYPSDVGIFGQAFMYGIPGAIILYSQFLLAYFYLKRIRNKRNIFFLSVIGFNLLVLFLESLTTGFLTIYAAHSITFMILVYFYYQNQKIKPNQHRKKNENIALVEV